MHLTPKLLSLLSDIYGKDLSKHIQRLDLLADLAFRSKGQSRSALALVTCLIPLQPPDSTVKARWYCAGLRRNPMHGNTRDHSEPEPHRRNGVIRHFQEDTLLSISAINPGRFLCFLLSEIPSSRGSSEFPRINSIPARAPVSSGFSNAYGESMTQMRL